MFTKKIKSILSEDDLKLFRIELVAHPETGKLIKRGGGIRKIRCKARGHGKRGGARIIYYWNVPNEQLILLFAYAKNERNALTKQEIDFFRNSIAEVGK